MIWIIITASIAGIAILYFCGIKPTIEGRDVIKEFYKGK